MALTYSALSCAPSRVSYSVSGALVALLAQVTQNGKNDSYRPLVVADMDLDGTPEVIVHFDESGWWGDLVFGFRKQDLPWSWKEIAMGGGGTTS